MEYDVYSQVCKDCGSVTGDVDTHNKWHGKIDSLVVTTNLVKGLLRL